MGVSNIRFQGPIVSHLHQQDRYTHFKWHEWFLQWSQRGLGSPQKEDLRVQLKSRDGKTFSDNKRVLFSLWCRKHRHLTYLPSPWCGTRQHPGYRCTHCSPFQSGKSKILVDSGRKQVLMLKQQCSLIKTL